jgi:hypothetical protein
VVTADGRQLAVGPDENGPVLGTAWGRPNLGIVTHFDYRLHPISQVPGGMVIYPLSHGARRCVCSTISPTPAPTR